MSALRPKRPRLRLDAEAYAALRQSVLQRDNWHCQSCGSVESLEVHHVQPRGRLGADAERNLITLCNQCHTALHFRRARTGTSEASLQE